MASTKGSTSVTDDAARAPSEPHITVGEVTQIADENANIKYSPWTRHMLRLYGVLLCAYFCACLNGYDGSVMGYVGASLSLESGHH